MRNRTPSACMLVCLVVLACAGAAAAFDAPPVYKPAYRYPVLEEIDAVRDSVHAVRDSLRDAVDARYDAEEKLAKEQKRSLRLDWSKIRKPAAPSDFESIWYFPPIPQYNTGTCWAFCSTSFLESEVKRLTGREVKLSEMWTVYWEYVEKARRYIREYGHSLVAEGSQDQGTIEILRQYGAVPEEAYRGVLTPDGRFDHSDLIAELKTYLGWAKDNDVWDETLVLTGVRAILDRYMGRPPETVEFEGRTLTPVAFRDEVLKIDPDDYVSCLSTMREPYGTWILHDVPDNWRRSTNWLNLPLDDFYRVVKESLQNGYGVSLGGDVSEPGLDGMEDAAVIPSWDVPHDLIDQASRELRIVNGTTSDDHGVHAVGYLRLKGQDWFLIKDSNRSSRLGQYKGYYFYHGDYIRLKTLAFMVHKDRLKGLLPDE